MEIFARERKKNFTRESGSRRATNNNSPFTEAIIDHRAPIEAYRFDTTDLERWCVKTEAGEWIIPRVEKELRGCQSSPMCFESETWVTIHRSLPRIDLDGLELDAPTDVTSTSLRSLEREMNWLVSVDATFFLTRVDEITRVPRSFDMVARHCDGPHTNRPTLYIYIYIFFFFSSFFLLLSLPPPIVWSTRWRINFTRLSTRHTTSWSFAMRQVSNSFFFFLFLTNYDFAQRVQLREWYAETWIEGNALRCVNEGRRIYFAITSRDYGFSRVLLKRGQRYIRAIVTRDISPQGFRLRLNGMIDPALLSLFSKGRVKFRRNSFLLRLQ